MSLVTNDNKTSKLKTFGFFKRYSLLTVLLIVVGAGIAFAMADEPEIYKFRYKMTVSVETPEGIKIGSAVREVAVKIEPFPLDKRKPWRSFATVKGEAVVVDLGQRGKLFSLLDGDDAYRIVFTTFPYKEGGLTPAGAAYYSKLKAGPQEIKQIPDMVTFKDIKDPKSVELAYRYEIVRVANQAADDYKITNNLESLFGEGVTVKYVTIEMTDEAITWGMVKHLAWINEYYSKMFDGQEYNTLYAKLPLANNMSAGSFSTGETINGQ